MKKIKLLFLIINVLIISSCDQTETDDADSEIRALSSVSLSVSYIDNTSMSILPTLADPLTNIIFPFISGAVGGYPSSENLIIEPVGNDREITLQLNESIFTTNTYPSLIDPSLASLGVSVSPSNTNFGRLAQFDEYEMYGDEGPYALFDNDNKFFFVIMYFDQAASLTGTVQNADTTTVYDIQIPGSGFYAVKIITTETGGSLVGTNVSNNLHFVYRR